MTKALYQSMFVSLSALLLAVLFVLTPTDDQDMAQFQSDIRTQFAAAAMELLEGESFSEPFALVWATMDDFYDQAANETLALLQPDPIFSDLAMMFNSSYQNDIKVAFAPLVIRQGYEDPIYNIVPMDENEILLDPYFDDNTAYYLEQGGRVLGESIDIMDDSASLQTPEIPPVTWMNINDSITGLPYCVAIFNASINSYPGYCATEDLLDSENHVYEN